MPKDADGDLIGWAAAIISNVDVPNTGWPNQTPEWREAARRWLGKAASPSGDASEVDL